MKTMILKALVLSVMLTAFPAVAANVWVIRHAAHPDAERLKTDLGLAHVSVRSTATDTRAGLEAALIPGSQKAMALTVSGVELAPPSFGQPVHRTH